MTLVILGVIVATLLFCFVVFFGAPYLPTLSKQKEEAFKLLGLKKGQHLLELGSGDGRMLAEAARKGIYSTGYELNPLLVLYTKLRYYRYRSYIKVYCRNYWGVSWPETDAIYTFLLDKYMNKLHKKIMQEYIMAVNPVVDLRADSSKVNPGVRQGRTHSKAHYGVKLVSFAFKIPGKKVTKEINGMYLYEY